LKIRIEASIQTDSIKKTKSMIEGGEKILELYKSKYDIEKRRIWLIRWKNGYEPYLHHVSAASGEKNIAEIDAIHMRIIKGT
jgi:hypothetical protein